jgi:sarcosine oxidase gamma subunit
MGDQRDKWPEIPAWDRAVMAWPDLVVRSMGDLCQHLVSGDLDAFRTYASLPAPEVGALELANGSRYSARLARDRILVVGADERRLQPGWNKAGFAVTRASSAFHVFEANGPGLKDLIQRATTLDVDNPGPSAVALFAGVDAVLYRYGSTDTLRVHVDRTLASYIWSWIDIVWGSRTIR